MATHSEAVLAIDDLLVPRQAPCVSIYMPTNRASKTREAQLAFRALVKSVGRELHRDKAHDSSEVEILARLEALDTARFWSARKRGLAVFASIEHLSCHRLDFPVPEIVRVAKNYCVLPLLRHRAKCSDYAVLVLSRGKVSLFEGQGESLSEVKIPDLPQSIADVVPSDDLDTSRVHFHSSGRTDRAPIYHSPGDETSDCDENLKRFMRAVDSHIFKRLGNSGVPLIIASRPREMAVYRRESRVPTIAVEGITCDPKTMPKSEVSGLAEAILNRAEAKRAAAVAERLEVARAMGKASNDLDEILGHSGDGRVETLLVGDVTDVSVVRTTDQGVIEHANRVEKAAREVLSHGGEIVFAAPDSTAIKSAGVAAIYRY